MAIGDARGERAKGLPDFILVGAPKCGTTSIHDMLAAHPRVFIPEAEIFFFDVDDVMVHPDFFMHQGGVSYHDYDADFEAYLAWYRSLFAPAAPGQLIGEDSTTYLSCPSAPARIAALLPDVKLVAMLRDPVRRAYSQYLHDVRAGRHDLSFERTLRTNPGSLLPRGFYAEQLERYRGFLDAGRMRVFFFEDFVADPAAVLGEVRAFLGLEPAGTSDEGLHSNAARPPLHLGTRLFVNHWIGHRFSSPRPRPNLPGYQGPEVADPQARSLRWYERLALRVDEATPRRRPPEMKPETRVLLEKVFAKRNAGLGELLGTDVAGRWPYMR